MSLSSDQVLKVLKRDFVVGWKNIAREDYVGSSHGYTCDDTAVGTTNGAGPRNMQMFVLSRGGVVVHCLPGFWHPDDLVTELQHAKLLHRLWIDDRQKSGKKKMFARMQLSAIRSHSDLMTARSGWQGFDAANERERLKHGPRDTFYMVNGKPKGMKPLNVLIHERMAKRPFVSFKKFDTEEFIDYGRPYYDNNGGGVDFRGSKGYLESQKRMAERRKIREEKRRKAEEYENGKKAMKKKLGKAEMKAMSKKKSKKSRKSGEED